MQSRSEIEVSQRHALTPGWLAVSGSTREVVSILRRLSGDANTCERVVTLLPASACRMHLKSDSERLRSLRRDATTAAPMRFFGHPVQTSAGEAFTTLYYEVIQLPPYWTRVLRSRPANATAASIPSSHFQPELFPRTSRRVLSFDLRISLAT